MSLHDAAATCARTTCASVAIVALAIAAFVVLPESLRRTGSQGSGRVWRARPFSRAVHK